MELGFSPNIKYNKYCNENDAQFKPLLMSFIKKMNTYDAKRDLFVYLNQILRLFLNINNKYTSYIWHNGEKGWEFTIKLINRFKRNQWNDMIMSNGHPIAEKGTHIKRFNIKKQSKQNSVDGSLLNSLTQLILSIFNGIKNEHAKALFIAFLKLFDRGQINEYSALQILISQCEAEIDGVEITEPTSYYYSPKPPKQYYTDDGIHYFDEDGNSSDEDMEYQINHLNIESIVKKVINKFLNECNNKG